MPNRYESELLWRFHHWGDPPNTWQYIAQPSMVAASQAIEMMGFRPDAVERVDGVYLKLKPSDGQGMVERGQIGQQARPGADGLGVSPGAYPSSTAKFDNIATLPTRAAGDASMQLNKNLPDD